MTAVAGGSNETPESSGGLLAQPASRAANTEVTTAIRLKDTPMRASLTHHRAVRNEQRLTPPRNLCPYPTNAVFQGAVPGMFLFVADIRAVYRRGSDLSPGKGEECVSPPASPLRQQCSWRYSRWPAARLAPRRCWNLENRSTTTSMC